MIPVVNSVRFTTCPLCKSSRIRLVGPIEYHTPTLFSSHEVMLQYPPELWDCADCRSGFVNNIIRESDASSLYARGSSKDRWEGEETFQQTKLATVTQFIAAISKPNVRFLDIGANTGTLLDFAKLNGSQTYAIELSDASQQVLTQKQHTVFENLSEATGQFDVISAFDLIEHMYNVPAFLDGCAGKLVKGGKLVMLTGNYQSLTARLTREKWWYLRYPEHIAFPGRKYYESLPNFRLTHWLQTYNSVGYRWPMGKAVYHAMKLKYRNQYNGLPSIGPDHVLIVLEKKI